MHFFAAGMEKELLLWMVEASALMESFAVMEADGGECLDGRGH